MDSKITRLRLQCGLSQERAARQIDISLPMWYKIEKGERTPSLRIAYKIARLFNASIEDVFSEVLQDA